MEASHFHPMQQTSTPYPAKSAPLSPVTPRPHASYTPQNPLHPNASNASLLSSSSVTATPHTPSLSTPTLSSISQPCTPSQPPPLQIPQVEITPPPGHIHPLETPFLTPSPPTTQVTPSETPVQSTLPQPTPLQIPQVQVIPPPGTTLPPQPQPQPVPVPQANTPAPVPFNFPTVPVVPEIKPTGWGTRERSKTLLGVPLPRRRRRPKPQLKIQDDSALGSCSTDPCVDVASQPVINYQPGSMLENNPVICLSPTYYGSVGRIKHTTGSIDPLPPENILDAAAARKRLILLKMKINEIQAKREVYWSKQATASGAIAVAGLSMVLPGTQFVAVTGVVKGVAAVVSGHGVVMDGTTLGVFKSEILACCHQINRLRAKWGEGIEWRDAEGMVRVKAGVFKVGIDRKVLKGEL